MTGPTPSMSVTVVAEAVDRGDDAGGARRVACRRGEPRRGIRRASRRVRCRPGRSGRIRRSSSGGSGGRQMRGEAAGDEHAQHGVQATDRPGAARDQVVVTFGEEAQHRRMIIGPDDAAGCGGASRRSRRERASCGRSCRCVPLSSSRTRAESFAGTSSTVSPDRDELLGQQRAGTGRTLDRPDPRFERRGEAQQAITLLTIRPHSNFRERAARGRSNTAAVCDPLCGSIPMTNTIDLLDDQTERRGGQS